MPAWKLAARDASINCAPTALTVSTSSAFALEGEPTPKGGAGLYSNINWSRRGVPHQRVRMVGEERRSGIGYWVLGIGKRFQNLGGVKAPDIIFRLDYPIPNP
jgi:hypothetical protein